MVCLSVCTYTYMFVRVRLLPGCYIFATGVGSMFNKFNSALFETRAASFGFTVRQPPVLWAGEVGCVRVRRIHIHTQMCTIHVHTDSGGAACLIYRQQWWIGATLCAVPQRLTNISISAPVREHRVNLNREAERYGLVLLLISAQYVFHIYATFKYSLTKFRFTVAGITYLPYTYRHIMKIIL